MAYCGPKGIPLSQFLEWSPDDQDAALAWQNHEAMKCPGCGTHPDDWRDDDHAFHGHNVYCPGCAAKASAGNAEVAKQPGMLTLLARGAQHECETCGR